MNTNPPLHALAQVAILVRDYDEAIGFYRDVLGFRLIEDRLLDDKKRWVVVAPRGGETRLLLARAANEAQRARVGDQAGGRVFLFLRTDDFWRDYRAWTKRGVQFTGEPRVESYGTVGVFRDLYGNLWDLIQPA